MGLVSLAVADRAEAHEAQRPALDHGQRRRRPSLGPVDPDLRQALGDVADALRDYQSVLRQ